MTIPFLQVKPKSIKLKVLPQFNSSVTGRVGIATTKQNGNFFVDLDYSYFPPSPTIPSTADYYILLWNDILNQYVLTPISQFQWPDAPADGQLYGREMNTWTVVPTSTGGISDAPSDGTTYGRMNAAWIHVLPLTGGTLTGTLTLSSDPAGALQAATKQYVDAHTANGVIPENSKSANYTTVLGDAGQFIYHPASDANARTFTIAANASVAYTLGTVISFVNMSANALTIAIASDTMYLAGPGTTGSRTLAQYGCATALKTDTTTWIISGTGLT